MGIGARRVSTGPNCPSSQEVGLVDFLSCPSDEVPPDEDLFGKRFASDEQNCRCLVGIDRKFSDARR